MRTTFPNGGGLSGGNGSTNVDAQNPYFIVTAEESNSLVVGMEVHKVGRTTGWTHGAIKQTCVDHYLPGNHLIRCAYEAWYVANGGDSGAPVWLYDSYSCSRCVQLAGIHNGRAEPGNDQARFSKLARIKSDLGGAWTIVRSKALTAPAVSGTVSSGRAVLSWGSVGSAVLYNVWVYFQEYYCDPDIGCIWRDRFEKLGETSNTTFSDITAYVSSYSGGSPSGAPGERRYWVIAESVTDLSQQSAPRYFQP